MIPWDDSAPALSHVDEDAVASGADPMGSGDSGSGPAFDRLPEDRYELRGVLGEGGMGRVFSAQDRHLRRDVALKVASTPELAVRLSREALITAQLEHPGIVAVYDAGRNADGQPWYTMRLIRGRTLDEQLRRCAGLAARLRLLGHFQDACQAVAYAQNMGIIHRDLKPANIMVGEFGETQVADWGVACPADDAVEAWSRLIPPAAARGASGTPRYMSPEQARGETTGRAADVWCLGVVLFELVSGERAPAEPGVGPDLDGLESSEMEVPKDLLAIARRCLEPDAADRYRSAGELAADVTRYLEGREVVAHDYTSMELLTRLVRAWKAPLAVGALGLLAMSMLAIVAAQRTRDARQTAEDNLGRALAQQALVALSAERRTEAGVIAAHALLLGPSAVARGVLAATAGPVPERTSRVDLPMACRDELWMSPAGDDLLCSSAGVLSLWDAPSMSLRWERPALTAFAPAWGASTVVVSTTSGSVRWLDRETGADVASEDFLAAPVVLSAHGDEAWLLSAGLGILASPASPMVASFQGCVGPRAASASHDGAVLLGCLSGGYELYSAAGELVQRLPQHDGTPDWSALFFDDSRILAGTREGTVHRFDRALGVWDAQLDGADGGVMELRAVGHSGLVVVLGERGGVRVWDTRSNAWVATMPAGIRRTFAGSDARGLVVHRGGLEQWHMPASLPPSVVRFDAGVSHVSVSPDGQQIVYALGSGVVGVLDRPSRLRGEEWSWQSGVAKCGTVSDDGLIFGAGMQTGGARRLWPGGRAEVIDALKLGYFRRSGALRDGVIWLAGYGLDTVLVHLATGEVRERIDAEEFFDGSSSPDRRRVVFASTVGSVWVHDAAGTRRVGEDPDAVAVDIDDQGRIITAHRRQLCVAGECLDLGDRIVDVAIAHGSRRVAVGMLSGDIQIVDLQEGRVEAVLRGHRKRVSSLEWGPDGTWLVSGSWDASVRYWDASALDALPSARIEQMFRVWGLDLDQALAASG